MIDEREELYRERDRLAAELSALGDTIEDLQAEIDEIENDTAALIWGRNTATKRLLPDERLPESVSNETRGAIASYLDTLGEKRDVRSDELERKTDRLAVETKNAADARDDVDEITAVIDRLEDRTDETESTVDDAREELDAARSRFEADLAELAARLEPFGIDLSERTLGAVIDDRIPEQKSEIQDSIERTRDRIGELSTRKTALAEDRDKLQSIAGGGTCPTCNQNVGPERNESEADAIEAELHQVERHLGAATQERDELIARREELADLRDQAIALGSFRSESVAGAAGRLEDRQENVEDLQADLTEERGELGEATAQRDDADAEIATLETEIDGLEVEIEELQAKTNEGETIIQAFGIVDDLRAQLEERDDERADLQAEYAEMESARDSLEAEIEALSDE